jgi:DNA-binding NarL/FixJ family response regulator
MSALVQVVARLPVSGNEEAQKRRRLLAELCKVIGASVSGDIADCPTRAKLSPRMRQTLSGLLRGDSEKQIAMALKVSPHTVHVYVKQLYKKLEVSSRGELLAKFVRTA